MGGVDLYRMPVAGLVHYTGVFFAVMVDRWYEREGRRIADAAVKRLR